ncbi:hypothetical protein ABQE69_14210 [Mycolicibacillus trivialis]
MSAVYLAVFAVGAVGVLTALLLTDIDAGADGMPLLSLTSLSAALLGAGTGGSVGTAAGLGAVATAVVAAASGVALLVVLQVVVLPYLRGQQGNSQRGRASYIGLLGTVTLDVPVDGWGEVAFVDADGNRVRSRAVSAETDPLTKSTRVYIADVDTDFVHVVAVPES